MESLHTTCPTLSAICTSPGGIPKHPHARVILSHDGLEGDGRNHDKHRKPGRALSLLGVDQLEWFRTANPQLVPGSLGENLLVSGLDVAALDPGDVIQFESGAKIQITEPRIPCYVLDPVDPTLRERAWGRIGQMARVLSPGTLSVGESLSLCGNVFRETTNRHRITAAVLAGGESSRMGAPKEGVLLPNGIPMMAQVLSTLRQVADRLVVVGKCTGYDLTREPDVLHIEDLHPGRGPMSGLHSLLATDTDAAYLVIACDQPLVTPYLLRVLLAEPAPDGRFIRDELGNRLVPFPGIFPAAWKPALDRDFAANRLSPTRFIDDQSPEWATIPVRFAPQLRSLNSASDLHNV